MKVKELLKQNKVSLRDKILLLAHLLKINHKDLYLLDDLEVPRAVEEAYTENLKRLEEGYPLQYILGEWEFYGKSFHVQEGILIPRPETEILVEEVLKRVDRKIDLKGLEIGVGSGCISITLLIHNQRLRMFANDINIKALKLAKRNAKRHGVEDRLFLFAGDLFEALKPYPFDLILSNPPYIPMERWESLPFGVKMEGYTSLIGGIMGWEFYLRIREYMDNYLNSDGFFAFEIGHDQGEILRNIFEGKGYKVEIIKDYANQDRVIVGWRS
ncbi:MAG: peptide chain release factor N(5)-glutamine methyltransferase [Aquificaceae bacterium]